MSGRTTNDTRKSETMIHNYKTILLASFVLMDHHSALGVLPPGYEDNMWCPKGSCDAVIRYEGGFAGPSRSFHECFDPNTEDSVGEVWTGYKTKTIPPNNWVKDPKKCDGVRFVSSPEEQLDNEEEVELLPDDQFYLAKKVDDLERQYKNLSKRMAGILRRERRRKRNRKGATNLRRNNV